MTFEFRFYCQDRPVVICVQVEAEDEHAAELLAAQAIRDLGRPALKWWRWKPGALILPGRE